MGPDVDVPSEFWGLWRRYSVALDGTPAVEPALVFWCQAPQLFMDLRWRIDPPESDALGLSVDRMMAGFTTYEDNGFMTWHHDMDSLIGAGSDRSAVRVVGDEMIEEGEVTAPDGQVPPRTFVEIWRRVSVDTPTITQLATDSGEVLTARAGDWVMEMTIPEAPDKGMHALLKCGATWTLGGTFGGNS